MKKLYLSLIIAGICCIATGAFAQVTFNYTGGVQYYTVPSGVSFAQLDIAGASGGNSGNGNPGGKGGRVVANMAVTPGMVLNIYVGGRGHDADYSQPGYAGGYNGGGHGTYGGGSGGGASDIRIGGTALSNRIVVAGAGSGGGANCGETGSDAGGTNGANGINCGSYDSYSCGAGGTQTSGGAGASGGGANGGPGAGGNCASGGYWYTSWLGGYYYYYYYYYGGGGGSGYYGGGGGQYGCGGGGSSYPVTGATTTYLSSVTNTGGYQTGDGYVKITPPTITASPTTLAFGNVTNGTTSVPPKYFILGGVVLTSGGTLTITPPANFQVSVDGVNWFSNATPLTYTYSGTAFSNVNVYVRFNPTALTSYSGNIVISGGGAPNANVAVTGTGVNACSGTPTAGSAAVSPSSGNVTTTFTLSLTGTSASGGLTYQWQSSPDNSTWTSITGAIFSTYSFVGISANTYFRCVVSCPSGASANSSSVLATQAFAVASSSCTPAFGTPCYYYNMSCSINSLVGASGSLSDASSSCSSDYVDNTGLSTATLNTGSTYNVTVNTSPSYYYYMGVQIWIDFNDDGVFQGSETVGGIAYPGISNPTQVTTISIPANANPGSHRMRIVDNYQCCGNSNYPSINPCPAYSVSYGQARDYKIIIRSFCSGTPNPGITAGAPSASCTAFSPNVFNVGEPIQNGITYQWQSSTTSATAGFTNIAGATGQGYVPTLSSVGTVYYRDSVRCTSSGLSAVSIATAETVNAPPSAIAGPGTTCPGATMTLSSTPTGGTWSSASPGNATIGSSSGIVTGVTGGSTAVITYTAPTGCFITTTITVNPLPAAITGTMVVCPFASVTLSDATTGGTWSSSNTALATVGSSTGVVTGVAGGNPVISYTAPTGCIATATITVNSIAAITGTPSMCLGYSTTLGDATPGGNWTSSNTAIATVNSSGVVSSVSVGTCTISYTVPSIGCSATVTVAVTNPPSAFTVTGGGSYCAGGTGVLVGVSSSNAGISYQLYNGATMMGAPIIGAGFGFNFPLQTVAGTYTVIANPGTACAVNGTGSASVVVNPLPTAFTVSGGGAYCAGSTGVHVYLNSSTIGVNYQLFVGSTPVGSPVPGTSAALDFGVFTTAGTYTVTAINTATTCFNTMAGSVTISINPVPNAYPVTGGGGYCTGGTGVTVGLLSSNTGISYQLLLSGTPTGAPVAGTGGPISFGLQTIGGVYTVLATNTTTGCQATMTGSATVAINSLPTVYTMTGGGDYCSGGIGVPVGLNGSQVGVNYMLYRGTLAVGTAVAGTGVSISFPLQTVAGSYTVIATNATTGCTSNMFGSSSVSINTLPTPFVVTGGGNYCSGGSGVHVGLASSAIGVNYQVLNGATVVGAGSGTGAPLDFGLFTAAGTYTVVGTNTITGCVGNMSGSVSIVVNPLPVSTYSVTVTGGGTYCAGGTGQTIGLSGSQSGISYQLFLSGVASGSPVSGTGSAISFGLRTAAGAYTVVGTNTSTTCTSNMTGSAVITINPLPTVFALTGGGGYCAGTSGTHIGLASSDVGINYQLYNGTSIAGAPAAGTGAALDFGLITAVGTYTVTATNAGTGCSKGMFGSTTVVINPLPAAYAVTTPGGTTYCAGGAGVHVGLANSASGVNYQLYNGGLMVGSPMAGTGSAIDFGSQTAGTYTVVAADAVTGCTKNMTGSAVITANPLPAIFTVTGGGVYCAGGTGIAVNLNGSASGISYQLYVGGVITGSPVAGTGSPISFGLQTTTGTYTVVATNTVTGCTNNMFGSVNVSTNPTPAIFTVTGGGNYCAGGTGVHVGLSSSTVGIFYQMVLSGSPAGTPVTGTGGAIDFGVVTTGGTYTVLATNTATGCTATMAGSAVIVVNPLPTLYSVSGGGNYCPAGTGVHVGLTGSNTGIAYQLYNGATAVGTPLAGTGAALDFGLQTALGTYTVVATNTVTGCMKTMTGSTVVGLYALPTIYNVTGGGNFCPGGTGVHVGISNSSLGINYQLYRGVTMVGAPVAGTGFALDFGLQTVGGTYTVVGTSTTTGCSISMNGNAVVGTSAVPTAHAITGGGSYCAGGTGVHIGLAISDAGIYYQLYNGITAVGAPMSGTGASLDFGLQTGTGTYTITGTSLSTTCSNTMMGSVTITVNALPTAYTISTGGNYCAGGAGVDIMLGGSDIGTDYQLYNGATPVGGAMSGTGAALDFGMQTASGAYVVIATDATTGCTRTMTGTSTINIDPLPTAYNVTGGGNYCAGGTGVHVMLSGSDVGTQYQLMNGTTAIGAPMSGTGFGLDFGLQTMAGSYYVVATNTATTCTGNMAGTVTVGVNPLPTVYTVSGFGSSYCAGGTGIDLSLSGSDLGISYQLFIGGTTVGTPVTGTGLPIDFGYMTTTGTYTVVAVNPGTTCMTNMAGSATVAVNPLPVAFNVTGGGSFCNGGSGVTVGLSSSNVGVSYQLYNGLLPVGSSVTGTGGAMSFGLQTAPGNYTVVATNLATTCTNNMTGSATVVVNPLPSAYMVNGGGNYCAGGAGVTVGLGGSALGISYQLKKGGVAVGSPMAGTGFPLSFGLQTAAGIYTVTGTNTVTGCSGSMTGSVSIAVNPLPVVYSVTGGGNYCPGGIGVHVGISGSNTGISYQLYNGTSVVGSPVAGTGAGVDFGLQTAAGTYHVVATDGTTGCTNNMGGSVNVSVSALPTVYNVLGGGNYCAGGAGVHIGLSGSTAGVSYQLYNVSSPVGAPVIGTGSALDLGLVTGAGTYTVIATDGSTGCSRNMSGSATIVVNPLLTPAVTITTGVGDTICAGNLTTFTAMAVNGGTSPAYQWTVNGIVTGIGSTYSYIPLNGDVVGVTLTSSASCAVPSSASNSIAMTVNTSGLPAVIVSTTPGTEVCQGTTVTFTATGTYGGSAPTYAWIKNGVNSGSADVYSYVPANGDVVYCIMTSNYHCRLANTATSSHIAMQVDMPVMPVVTITANPGTQLASGQSAVFTASVTNGGPAPTFQWFVNGIAQSGANGPSFTTNALADNDSVSCEVLSSGGCSGVLGYSSVIVHVSGVGVNTVTANESNITLIPNPNKGIFTVKGTLGTTADEEVSLEVTDMLGQVIFTTKVMTHSGVINQKIQLSSSLANGMYMLNLRSGSDNKVFHIVVEQ